MALTDVTSLICPVCAESVQDRPPLGWIVPGVVPAWSHARDGSALCDTITPAGYAPADAVEVRPRELSADEFRTLSAIDRNYGPFGPEGWTIGDVIDLITVLDQETGGELSWCDGAAILTYMRTIGAV
ncbi:MAG: hypothetical protein ABS80_23935 [Pseudonocardia sp. SCN 72-51]|nr:MAG: hypothetical protein ABS80_23935 [Pseudonocardia sp. SCN 72-51]